MRRDSKLTFWVENMRLQRIYYEPKRRHHPWYGEVVSFPRFIAVVLDLYVQQRQYRAPHKVIHAIEYLGNLTNRMLG